MINSLLYPSKCRTTDGFHSSEWSTLWGNSKWSIINCFDAKASRIFVRICQLTCRLLWEIKSTLILTTATAPPPQMPLTVKVFRWAGVRLFTHNFKTFAAAAMCLDSSKNVVDEYTFSKTITKIRRRSILVAATFTFSQTFSTCTC